MSDLFSDSLSPQVPKPKKAQSAGILVSGAVGEAGYSASDIEVLEGLEPVRRRPGMYIGGTDEKAYHHLFAEVIDNSMDEAVAGHASFIDVHLSADGVLSVTDNGRGIPIDPHPKFPNKSALEVIMTTLHAGGKFDGKAYETSGGLHGVGVSVVNALSDVLDVEVARGQQLYAMRFSRGAVALELQHLGAVHNRRGTKVSFHPDPDIFGPKARFKPERLYKMARSKAYLFAGVEIRWSCDEALLGEGGSVPAKDTFHFPNGLKDYLASELKGERLVVDDIFAGRTEQASGHGAVEWAIAWKVDVDSHVHSYCNTIPTHEGGTHESGLRAALLRSIRSYGELINHKKIANIISDDIFSGLNCMLSVFIREPEFVGQTKDKLSTTEAARIVDTAIRDKFDHWLTSNPKHAGELIEWIVERSDDRLRRKRERDVVRKSAVKRLRLPGKLADCQQAGKEGSELFIVEGDSAGGSAKQARDRKIQAVLPLRGKILNVASATREKSQQNQQISDLLLALGCDVRSKYREEDLRYDKVIIMTDADVDGAHIASLLITFFFQELPKLIEQKHLYLAVPPLYRLSQGGKTLYARDDAHKDEILETVFDKKRKIEIGRFKGLGEMTPPQLKETTMNVERRTLLRVSLPDDDRDLVEDVVNQLMGTKPEARFEFIQKNAQFVDEVDV